eukprot:TRINITY_DN17743_c0_g1_i1.p1 TRINITY_DN17743_c0_g1~~TRINITY_DN17743_c0_g1_i1.p1  ORF type:complete len:501 (+),score=134.81 TRINITY_DN17743_c0_g1_i1:49-1503(+)
MPPTPDQAGMSLVWINRHNTEAAASAPPAPAALPPHVLENAELAAFSSDMEVPARPREHSPEARNQHGPKRPLNDFASGMIKALDALQAQQQGHGGRVPSATSLPAVLASPFLSVNTYPPVLSPGPARRVGAGAKRERELSPGESAPLAGASSHFSTAPPAPWAAASASADPADKALVDAANVPAAAAPGAGGGPPGMCKRACPSPHADEESDMEDEPDAYGAVLNGPEMKRPRGDVADLRACIPAACGEGPRPPYCAEQARAVFERYHSISVGCLRGRFECDGDAAQRYIGGDGLQAMLADLGWAGHGTPSMGLPCFFFVLGTKYLHLISEAELHAALRALQTSDLHAAVQLCEYLHASMLQDFHMFQQYFSYTFHFFKPPDQKRLDRVTAQRLLFLVCPTFTFTSTFAHYLNVSGTAALTFDQWKNFLHFSAEISPTCHNYSDYDAWPTLYDGYVEWLRQTHAQPQPQPHVDLRGCKRARTQ